VRRGLQAASRHIYSIDGAKGFFRGAGPLMGREVPFYVFGMVIFEQYCRVLNGSYFGSGAAELKDWQVLGIGGLAGATASFLTTPADVLKSRMMTAPAGSTAKLGSVIVELIQKEGVPALFKGALPRAVWIAPLGAMNFAGYELLKRGMGVASAGKGGADAEVGADARVAEPSAVAVEAEGRAAEGAGAAAPATGTHDGGGSGDAATAAPDSGAGAPNTDVKAGIEAGAQPASDIPTAGGAPPQASLTMAWAARRKSLDAAVPHDKQHRRVQRCPDGVDAALINSQAIQQVRNALAVRAARRQQDQAAGDARRSQKRSAAAADCRQQAHGHRQRQRTATQPAGQLPVAAA
jgi:Mitochondrial carrier protein